MHDMCGRVIQASPPDQLGLKIIDALDPRDNRVTGDPFGNVPPRYNGAPSQQLWVIRQNPQTGARSLDLLQWGLIPYWCKDKPKPPPINAKAETVDRLPMFREAYRKRRCIVPIDGFFEWMAVKGAKVKQPYAIAMKDRSPFGLAGLWENWKNPATGEWVRTFCIITTSTNELVGRIHDRMPAIFRPEDYSRWLALDPARPSLLQPFPSEPMEIWPITTRVNSPKNDDADLLEPLADADACRPKDGNSA
jgi:putative SOS response-associated peptidase YedK